MATVPPVDSWYAAFFTWLPTSRHVDSLTPGGLPPTSADFHAWLGGCALSPSKFILHPSLCRSEGVAFQNEILHCQAWLGGCALYFTFFNFSPVARGSDGEELRTKIPPAFIRGSQVALFHHLYPSSFSGQLEGVEFLNDSPSSVVGKPPKMITLMQVLSCSSSS